MLDFFELREGYAVANKFKEKIKAAKKGQCDGIMKDLKKAFDSKKIDANEFDELTAMAGRKMDQLGEELDEWKKETPWHKSPKDRKDKFGNKVKDKNVAKNLAKKASKQTADMKEEAELEEGSPLQDLKNMLGKKFNKNYAKAIEWMKKTGKTPADAARMFAGVDARTLADMTEELEKDSDDPCWKDYVQLGTKKKNGKEVPNCVPKESVELEEALKIPKKGLTRKTVKTGEYEIKATQQNQDYFARLVDVNFQNLGFEFNHKPEELIKGITQKDDELEVTIKIDGEKNPFPNGPFKGDYIYKKATIKVKKK